MDDRADNIINWIARQTKKTATLVAAFPETSDGNYAGIKPSCAMRSICLRLLSEPKSNKIEKKMGRVDVLIQPQVGMYSTFEFSKVWDIIKRGDEALCTQMATRRRLLAPRPRKACD